MLRVWALIWLWVAGCARAFGSEWSYEGATITLANLNISYSDPATGMNRTDVGEVGKFGSGAVGVAAGILIVGHSLDGGDPRHNRHGCKMPWAVVPPNEPWVALVSRGECADREKIANAQALNASAILVYAKDAQERGLIISIFIIIIIDLEVPQLISVLRQGRSDHSQPVT